MGLFDGDPSCRYCRMETETVQHIICCCEALSRQHYMIYTVLNRYSHRVTIAQIL